MSGLKTIDTDIINSDRFSDLPSSARDLYIFLLANSDKDGDIYNAKAVSRSININTNILDALEDAGFIESLENEFYGGYYNITDWERHLRG